MARERTPWKRIALMLPATGVLAVCFAVPLLALLSRSFFSDPSGVGGSLTLENYHKALFDSYYLRVLWTTVRITTWVTIISLLVSYPIAYALARVIENRAIKRLIYAMVITPLFTSAIVRAFGWMVILGRQGVVNRMLIEAGIISGPLPLLYNEAGVIIGSVYILAPFMVLSIASVLQGIDRNLEEAAADLGASPWVSFWTVVWPLSVPGVVAGATIVFTLSMSSYVTPAVLGGGNIKVLPMLVYEQFLSLFNWSFGSALVVALLVATLAIIATFEWIGGPQGRGRAS